MRAALLIVAFALSACQTPCPAPAAEAVVMTFTCEDGSNLRVTSTPEQATFVQEGYTTLTLPDRITGSGFRYADNGAEFSGRSNEARWTRPGAAETVCTRAE